MPSVSACFKQFSTIHKSFIPQGEFMYYSIANGLMIYSKLFVSYVAQYGYNAVWYLEGSLESSGVNHFAIKSALFIKLQCFLIMASSTILLKNSNVFAQYR